MDLMDPASIASFAERFLASGRPLHILVASAGIGGAPLSRDSRGYESHFATNHLGHFDLVSRLRPALRRAEGARVVIVSSWAHRSSEVMFDDPNYLQREYDPVTAYGQSKTANVLFALALDGRSKSEEVPRLLPTSWDNRRDEIQPRHARGSAGGGGHGRCKRRGGA